MNNIIHREYCFRNVRKPSEQVMKKVMENQAKLIKRTVFKLSLVKRS